MRAGVRLRVHQLHSESTTPRTRTTRRQEGQHHRWRMDGVCRTVEVDRQRQTSEAAEKCLTEKRKTINGEDILTSLRALGFDNYEGVLKVYLAKFREVSNQKLTPALHLTDRRRWRRRSRSSWQQMTKTVRASEGPMMTGRSMDGGKRAGRGRRRHWRRDSHPFLRH